MTFKKASDRLFSRINHEDLAKTLGVSVPSIRQARLSPDVLAHPSPPPGWETAVLWIGEERVSHFRNSSRKFAVPLGSLVNARAILI